MALCKGGAIVNAGATIRRADRTQSLPKTLCLNMIVRNEIANLERCLAAVAPHVGCWVIGDTGSTDGTQDFIRAFFAARGIPGELHSFEFVNFEQARNAALDRAYASALAFDYLLLTDADMELVVDDPGFRERLEAPCYSLLQRAGISYWNARLARRDVGARYRGVTHEFLDAPNTQLSGAWFIDHATGSNRVDKFERDIRLLTAALETEPDNARYVFYLAQSLRDAGRTAEAMETYARRAGMDGWVEETWHARLSQARCRKALGDEEGFVATALAAFDLRPQRAEPLYDLARHYRERGMNNASAAFSEAGMAMPKPGDALFVEDFVYQTGLKEEFSIAAFYSPDPGRRARGGVVCDELALGRDTPEAQRSLARQNLRFYARPLAELALSFRETRLDFTAPEGWHAMNPSIARHGDEIVLAQRTVNYTLTDDGRYEMAGQTILTRNFLLRLTPELDVVSAKEMLPPGNLPPSLYPHVSGFEDPRLFAWRGALWCSSNVRELTAEGWCQQVLARIDERPDGTCRLADWRVMEPAGPIRHEKNWMPLVSGDRLGFIYQSDPLRMLDDAGATTAVTIPPIAGDGLRGSTQAVAFDGGWLALVHEVSNATGWGVRTYLHRFISLGPDFNLRGLSAPFFFQKAGVEFAAGLAWHPDGRRLMISYSVADRDPRIATLEADEARALLIRR